MQIETLLAIGAVTVAHEEVALGHLPQVILVQELAMLALLAQPAQPVLADERVQAARRAAARGAARGAVRDVALGTARAVGAVPRLEGLAYRAVGGEADLVGLAQEGREAEVVGGRGMLEDGGGGGLGGCGSHDGRSPRRRAGLS